MRIGVDACCWSNRRGFGRFTRELVTHLVDEFPAHAFTLLADDASARAGGFPPRARLVSVATREQPTQAASAAGARSPFDLLRLSLAAARLDVDLFFFPAVYSFFPLVRRVPSVVTFHDTIAEDHPELVFPGRRARLFWTLKCRLARRQCDRVLTVSASARARLAARWRVPEASIHVVSEGPSAVFRRLDDGAAVDAVRARHGLPADVPLLLYVGGISPHKNIQGLLRALARLRGVPWHLALVGDHAGDAFLGCYRELRALCATLALESRVTFTGFVPNEELCALYNAATLFVLPSFDEGFGLPAVEAMACGAPLAASARGSLPEVVGEAGVLFDPSDEPALAALVRELLADPGRRARMSAAGLRRAACFSWSTAARAAMQVFEGLARAA